MSYKSPSLKVFTVKKKKSGSKQRKFMKSFTFEVFYIKCKTYEVFCRHKRFRFIEYLV